jgi:hypothetical protein
MIDIWGYGSNGLLINMVYNTHYGMGYNNTTLTKEDLDEFLFYSSSTIAIRVYIYESGKVCESIHISLE